MGICPCFGRKKKKKKQLQDSSGIITVMMNKEADTDSEEALAAAAATPHLTHHYSSSSPPVKLTSTLEPRLKCSISLDSSTYESAKSTFSYRELAAATNNFRSECLIGEGGFGSVYRGMIERTGQVVAIKKLDPSGVQGSREFLVEVLMLSLLHHPSLVDLVGFCAEGEQRLLVYEYLPLGSLEYHLHDSPPDVQPLDWNTRMKIAAGIAEGLDYLHNQADPAVIHRDLKSSNVLLDEGFRPKLSDFGLAKFGPPKDKSHVSTRVMGTEGYCAPEYYDTGKLTAKSDIYCFGILLLEIITGRRAKDTSMECGTRTLLEWAHPFLRDPKNFVEIVDEGLEGQLSYSGLHLAIDVSVRCLQENPQLRPSTKDVLSAMELLRSKRFKHIAADGGQDDQVRDGMEACREKGTPNNIITSLRLRAVEEGSGQEKPWSKDQERERAVAEAKLWGETWRAKMQLLCAQSELDRSNL